MIKIVFRKANKEKLRMIWFPKIYQDVPGSQFFQVWLVVICCVSFNIMLIACRLLFDHPFKGNGKAGMNDKITIKLSIELWTWTKLKFVGLACHLIT